ncbi:MAG: (2Fe-2S) ferredoxin domain-containing protein [Ruminococcaceae bacterium]|nr:(2Fe-2S) ferredoxin domain-containing protein [Oscillospiraceae bacterium]
MDVTVCIGSSCHVKGSHRVVDQFQKLIEEHKLHKYIELKGAFCMGRCSDGVCVTVDGEAFTVFPETAKMFFESNIMTKLRT